MPKKLHEYFPSERHAILIFALLFVDAVIFFFAIAMAAQINAKHGPTFKALKMPYVFDVYYTHVLHDMSNVTKFFATSVADKPLCPPLSAPATVCPAGSTNWTTFIKNLHAVTSCTPGPVLAPGCAQCVDLWGNRTFDAASALDDRVISSTVDAEERMHHRYRNGMEACLARVPSGRMLKRYSGVDPWMHMALWAGIALMCSAAPVIVDFTPWAKFLTMGMLALGNLLLVICLLNVNKAKMEAGFDVFNVAPQLFFALVAGIHCAFAPKSTTSSAITFGAMAIAAAPSIATIVSALHAWLNIHMIYYVVSLLIVFFTLTMLDDVVSVAWASSVNANAHMHTHALLFALQLFVVFTFATVNLPPPPLNDALSGTLVFTICVLFLVTFTLAPVVLTQIVKAPVDTVVLCRQLVSTAARLAVLVVLFEYYMYGVDL